MSVERLTINEDVEENEALSRIIEILKSNPKVKRVIINFNSASDSLKILRVARKIYTLSPHATVIIYSS